jgi:hypothetical protein
MLDTLWKRLVRSVTLAVLLAAVIGFTLGVYAPCTEPLLPDQRQSHLSQLWR